MAEKLVPKYKNKRHGQVIKRVNRRLPALKVWILLILLALGAISLWALSMVTVPTEQAEAPTETEAKVTASISGYKLSDGLELGTLGAAFAVAPEVEASPVEPEPVEVLPPPAYAPLDAGVEGAKYVALTFDDGPMGETTGRLLEILKAKRAKVTFFVLGRQMRAYPDLVRLAEADGHEIESHTVHHQNLYYQAVNQIQEDTGEMRAIFTEILGHEPQYLRPPYGLYNDFVINGAGMPLITWSVDPWDWAAENQNAEVIRQKVVTATSDGAIILLHDIYPSTIEAVAGIIDDLRNFGYEFVTVSEMAQQKGIIPIPGGVYRNF